MMGASSGRRAQANAMEYAAQNQAGAMTGFMAWVLPGSSRRRQRGPALPDGTAARCSGAGKYARRHCSAGNRAELPAAVPSIRGNFVRNAEQKPDGEPLYRCDKCGLATGGSAARAEILPRMRRSLTKTTQG